ncbi:MAG: ABC transporter substrate-binding protein [Ornithinimicrobium sp.]|uniref:ABC transporter substrate-binding protein n=1 Tax=Ornithinimicrobium sp. TaxID=1977084 RepID=UPI0026DEABF5|nr:ABC transporter substrate-binding protein [Ornithinimicrobium sp.]MDO5739830.1 ABC transporter substrate-binding protein [Ornithinimicrobium sp.]
MNMRSLVAISGASILAFSLSACGGSSDDKGDAAGLDLVSSGTLTVCSDVPYPPFEDFDTAAASGFSGFDIDIVQAVADGLDLKLAVKDSSFDGLQSGLSLNAGECDVAASAMTITEDRAKSIAFSDGYYDSKQSLLVSADGGISSIADLDGKNVGVQQGTTGESYAKENAKGAKLIAFPSNAEMFQAMKAGQVDALLQDLPVNVDNAKVDGSFKVAEEYSTDETYGLAMKKGNTALVEAVNKELTALRDGGDYQLLYDKYFTAGDDAASTSR